MSNTKFKFCVYIETHNVWSFHPMILFLFAISIFLPLFAKAIMFWIELKMVLLKSNNDFDYFCLQFFCRIWAKTEEKVRNHESLYEYFYFRTYSSEGVHAPIQRHFQVPNLELIAGQPPTARRPRKSQRSGQKPCLCNRTSLQIEARSALKSALKSRFFFWAGGRLIRGNSTTQAFFKGMAWSIARRED